MSLDYEDLIAALSNTAPTIYGDAGSNYVSAAQGRAYSTLSGLSGLGRPNPGATTAEGEKAKTMQREVNTRAQALLTKINSILGSLPAGVTARFELEAMVDEVTNAKALAATGPKAFADWLAGRAGKHDGTGEYGGSFTRPVEQAMASIENLDSRVRDLTAKAAQEKRSLEQEEYARKTYESQQAAERDAAQKAKQLEYDMAEKQRLAADEREMRRLQMEEDRIAREEQRQLAREQAVQAMEQQRFMQEQAMEQQRMAAEQAIQQARLQAELSASMPAQASPYSSYTSYSYGSPTVLPVGVPGSGWGDAFSWGGGWGEPDYYASAPMAYDLPAPSAGFDPTGGWGSEWFSGGYEGGGLFGLGFVTDDYFYGPAGSTADPKAKPFTSKDSVLFGPLPTFGAVPGSTSSTGRTAITMQAPTYSRGGAPSGSSSTDWAGAGKSLAEVLTSLAPLGFQVADAFGVRRSSPAPQVVMQQQPSMLGPLAGVAAIGAVAYFASKAMNKPAARRRGR